VRQWVFHVDLDQFIAAVEVLRRPELRGRPVVVGGDGDPTKRGVVSTASYEARRYGVGSGMPLRTAYQRCPEAVFLPVDAPAYRAASDAVMSTLREFDAVVEVLGWDEAFLGVRTHDPEGLARDVQRAVHERTGLWCSIGVGDNKVRAKLASGFAKPAGVFRLTGQNWREVMAHRPTDALWGIGTKTARKLAVLGIGTVDELAGADPHRLADRFGPNTGPWLRHLATGEDASPVSAAPYRARSRGREETYQRDIADPAQIREAVVRLAGRVALDVRREDRPAVRVVVKVRFAPFFTATHGVSLSQPTTDPDPIRQAALAALDRFRLDRPVRLLGVRAELRR
jgi:nucleotidyltransferase/DNA polymerase involved in DNA repair